ncbi:MAG: hypothetical protein RL391_1673 [Actinomycetota bacterium]
MTVEVLGRGELADSLRRDVASDIDATVIVVGGRPDPIVTCELSDAQIDELWERPMQEVIVGLQGAHARGAKRIVVVVPTTGMSGGSHYAATAALAEAARVLVKSAARQWGADGITVNAVAVDPNAFGLDSKVSGPVSIAPRALEGSADPTAAVQWLCSSASAQVTGQTIVCDGGLWM